MSYDPIVDGEIDPESAIVEELLRKMRDNPIAMAEGALGAPRVEGRALDTHMGAVTSSGTTGAGFTGLDRFELVRADFYASSTATTVTNLRVRFSSNNGSSWGSWQNVVITTGSITEISIGSAMINLRTGQYWAGMVRGGAGGGNFGSGTLTVPSNCNAMQFSSSDSNANLELNAYCLGGLTA